MSPSSSLFFACIFGIVTSVYSDVDIFMSITPSGSSMIKGDVIVNGYADWIEAYTIHMNIARAVSGGTRNALQLGDLSASTMTVVSQLKRAFVPVFQQMVAANPAPLTILIHETNSVNTPNPYAFIVYTLNNAYITNLDISNPSAEGPDTHTLQISYSSITVKYTPEGSNGRPGTPVQASWDRTV
eukprot:TRINITY_DN14503_c0_g1_i1.p1 TRINITY_DN14503_c0_g1~~TRINITY_DN14503_c0_g1_i1.p1  ORF type:complete len:195 (-),score=21.24 TRINITY_DN14503_c0_g1_i1:15-569(-)